MRVWMLWLVMLLALTACGGGSDEDGNPPTPTPAPTLTVEERVQFTPGSQQNPFRMTVRPTDTVHNRVTQLVAVAAGTRFDAVRADSLLRDDLGLSDDLAVLTEPIARDFAVGLGDPATIETVGDLVNAVHNALAAQASDAIFEITRLYVEVIPVDIAGEGLSGVCDSGGGIVTIPWVDGVTYAATQALNCGDPGLLVAVAEQSPALFAALDYVEPEPTPEATPETTPEATAEVTPDAEGESTDTPLTATPTPEPTSTPEPTTEPEVTPEVTPETTPDAPITAIGGVLNTGDAAVIILSGSLGSTSLNVLPGRAFCRVSVDSLYGWLIPTLIFERDNIEPGEIIDVANTDALIAGVADGTCAGGGLPARTFDALDDVDDINVGTRTAPIPLGVLVYPVEIALGERVNFNENLPELAADLEASRPLRLLLGQDALVPAEPESFTQLNTFIAATGVDLAGLAE